MSSGNAKLFVPDTAQQEQRLNETVQPAVAGPVEPTVKRCKVCGSAMRLVKRGARKPQHKCQPCHTKNVREKYTESRNRASTKFRKTNSERYAQIRWHSAFRICGVPSGTSVRSKKSEKDAFNARQRWTIEGDDLVLSGKHTESQLAKMLGRSIRAIQRRRNRLREAMSPNVP